MCIRIHIRYVRSSLAVVVFFLIKSQSKRSPGTNFAAEDMKKSERYSFIAAMFEFRIESNSAKTFEYSKFRKRIEYSSYPTHFKTYGTI